MALNWLQCGVVDVWDLAGGEWNLKSIFRELNSGHHASVLIKRIDVGITPGLGQEVARLDGAADARSPNIVIGPGAAKTVKMLKGVANDNPAVKLEGNGVGRRGKQSPDDLGAMRLGSTKRQKTGGSVVAKGAQRTGSTVNAGTSGRVEGIAAAGGSGSVNRPAEMPEHIRVYHLERKEQKAWHAVNGERREDYSKKLRALCLRDSEKRKLVQKGDGNNDVSVAWEGPLIWTEQDFDPFIHHPYQHIPKDKYGTEFGKPLRLLEYVDKSAVYVTLADKTQPFTLSGCYWWNSNESILTPLTLRYCPAVAIAASRKTFATSRFGVSWIFGPIHAPASVRSTVRLRLTYDDRVQDAFEKDSWGLLEAPRGLTFYFGLRLRDTGLPSWWGLNRWPCPGREPRWSDNIPVLAHAADWEITLESMCFEEVYNDGSFREHSSGPLSFSGGLKVLLDTDGSTGTLQLSQPPASFAAGRLWFTHPPPQQPSASSSTPSSRSK
ncbi:hypothetical protein BV20DRAFT_983821 [Pilatotrama ljubarskyi]|nr:hypothetical protein BV20DRAFT_983821 [Pilatotrama ljubarskyi]